MTARVSPETLGQNFRHRILSYEVLMINELKLRGLICCLLKMFSSRHREGCKAAFLVSLQIFAVKYFSFVER